MGEALYELHQEGRHWYVTRNGERLYEIPLQVDKWSARAAALKEADRRLETVIWKETDGG